jgi:hypothetical protein
MNNNKKDKLNKLKTKLNRLNQQITKIKKIIIKESGKGIIIRLNKELKSKEKQKINIIKQLQKLQSNVEEQKENDSVSNNTFVKDSRKQRKRIANQKKQKSQSNAEIFLRNTIQPKIDIKKEEYEMGPRKTRANAKKYSKQLINDLQQLIKSSYVKKSKLSYVKNEIARQVNNAIHGKKCSMKYGLNDKLKEELSSYSHNSVIQNDNQAFLNYTREEENWNQYCNTILDPKGPFSPTVLENVKSERGRLDILISKDREFKKNIWENNDRQKFATKFWSMALNGTIADEINNQAKFPEIITQDIRDDEIKDWYKSGNFGMNLAGEVYDISTQAIWQVSIDIIEKVFCKTLFIGKGMIDIIPFRDDLNHAGILFKEWNVKNHNPDFDRWDPAWDNILNLRETVLQPTQPNYWNIVENQPMIKLNRNNLYALQKAKPEVLDNRQEIYLDYLIRDYMNSLDDNGIEDWQKKLGICAFPGVRSPRNQDGELYERYEDPDNDGDILLSPETDKKPPNSFSINHANLIFFTPVTNHGVIEKNDNNKILLQCSYYETNNEIVPHVKPLIKRMVDNLRKKYESDNTMNCIIKKDIHWISPEDINKELLEANNSDRMTISMHGMFGFVKHGVCQHVAYLMALLWGKFGRFFDNPKHMWTHLSITLNKRGNSQLKTLFTSFLVGTMKIMSRIFKEQEVVPYMKAFIDKIKKQEKNLNDNNTFESQQVEQVEKVENKGCLGNFCSVSGGKKVKKVKKVRKHRGIHQTGGNKGKLKKGYKYSGKKLKNGKAEIVKCKSKKC